jgi:hypothetical protein
MKQAFNVQIADSLFDGDRVAIVQKILDKAHERNIKSHIDENSTHADGYKPDAAVKVFTKGQGITAG